MAACCTGPTPESYEGLFNDRYAQQLALQYRRRGLTPPAQRIVEFIASQGIQGTTVLEIGGGIGDIQLELLKLGTSRTTNLELSGAYESIANTLIQEAGFQGRVQRIQGIDLAVTPDALATFDVVVLHRVVCCYPDADRLLSAAASHARHTVVLSHPPYNWLGRLSARLMNAWLRILRDQYRAFAHDPVDMVAVLERHGFVPGYRRAESMWRIIGASRI